jgi:PilZ domain-containing protein
MVQSQTGYMNSYYRSPAAYTPSSVAEDERRYNDRNRFLTRVLVRNMDGSGEERPGMTQDLSRDGLYFVVRVQDYAVGMRLRVTLPETKSEWICEVVRIESLPNGGQGVAVVRVAA